MRRTPNIVELSKKTAAFFYGLFDFSTGTSGNFYPVAQAGQSAPPVNFATSETGKIVSTKTALQISAAWSCVWLIAETIATLPFILNQRSGTSIKAAIDYPLFTILNATPNSQMSAAEFWSMMLASELLWGNGYALKTVNGLGEVANLDPLRPEFVTPYKDAATQLIRYKYYLPGGKQIEDYSADQIFHLKGRSMDGLVGLSRIEYARNSLGIAKAAESATADSFRNGLRSGGFVQYKNFLKKDQRDQLTENLKQFTTGEERSGGMMVLEGGMDFKAITMNPQDVQLLASRQFAVEDICRWFGVPPVLVGHAAAGVTSWGTGIEQLLTGWKALTLRPYVRRIEQTVARSLIPPQDRARYYLSIDTEDLLGADSAARSALWATFGQNGIMTRNEIRAREDLAPVAGGDTLTVQSNLIPIDKLGQTAPASAVPANKPVEGAKPATQPALGEAA